MSVALLDANALVALTVADHEHHDRVGRWFTTTTAVAVSPVVEGALMRFLVRLGESTTTGRQLICAVHEHPACERWADDLSYADVDLADVRGHQQVTDSYLVGLASARAGVVATLTKRWPPVARTTCC